MTCRRCGLGHSRADEQREVDAVDHAPDPFGQGHAQGATDGFDEFVGPDRAVGVAELPELFGVAEVARRQVVQPIPLHHEVHRQHAETLRRRHESTSEVRHLPAVWHRVREYRDAVVAAVRRKWPGTGSGVLQERIELRDRFVHGMPPSPSAPSVPPGALPASFSLFCRYAEEERPGLVREADVVDGQHAQSDAGLGTDRVEGRIERFLGDAEVGDADRQDALLAPDEERQRSFRRRDLDRARTGEAVSREQVGAGRVDQGFEGGELGLDAELRRLGMLLRGCELLGRVDLGVELDGFNGRPFQSQGFGSIAPFSDALHLQRARERVGVVLEHDDVTHRAGVGVQQHEAGAEEFGGLRKRRHGRSSPPFL